MPDRIASKVGQKPIVLIGFSQINLDCGASGERTLQCGYIYG